MAERAAKRRWHESLGTIVAAFAEGYVVSPKTPTLDVVIVLTYTFNGTTQRRGSVRSLQVREADVRTYMVTLCRGDDDTNSETVVIRKRDLNSAVHIFSPEATGVAIRYRCLVTIGRGQTDLADCIRCHDLVDLARKCRAEGERLVHYECPKYHVNVIRVATLLEEIKKEGRKYANICRVFPPDTDAGNLTKLES